MPFAFTSCQELDSAVVIGDIGTAGIAEAEGHSVDISIGEEEAIAIRITQILEAEPGVSHDFDSAAAPITAPGVGIHSVEIATGTGVAFELAVVCRSESSILTQATDRLLGVRGVEFAPLIRLMQRLTRADTGTPDEGAQNAEGCCEQQHKENNSIDSHGTLPNCVGCLSPLCMAHYSQIL